MATHDSLTGLCNRLLFAEHLTQGIEYAKRYQRPLAVLFIDVDKFKSVNDLHGHSVGDQLLRHVADVLRHCIRKVDIAARFGGDEFVVMLGNLDESDDSTVIASRIASQLQEPVVLDSIRVKVTCSIGIAVYPDDGDDCEALLRASDEAMYRIKHRGGDGFQFYALRTVGKGKV